MEAQNVSISEAVVRYFLMMAVIVVAGFAGTWWLALLALPLFLTAITGFCPIKRIFQNGKNQKKNLTVHHAASREKAKAA